MKTEEIKDLFCRLENMGYHFADVSKMVSIGSGAECQVDDIILTRHT